MPYHWKSLGLLGLLGSIAKTLGQGSDIWVVMGTWQLGSAHPSQEERFFANYSGSCMIPSIGQVY